MIEAVERMIRAVTLDSLYIYFVLSVLLYYILVGNLLDLFYLFVVSIYFLLQKHYG
jgi:hypothetical protein